MGANNMNFISELYYGNFRPVEQRFVRESEYEKLTNAITKIMDNLEAKASQEDEIQFEKLEDYQIDLSGVVAEDNYTMGFRDGAKIIIDVLLGENKSLRKSDDRIE